MEEVKYVWKKQYMCAKAQRQPRGEQPNRGSLGGLYRGSFHWFCFPSQSSPYLVLVWPCIFQPDGFQQVSSSFLHPSPRLKAFSVHASGREIHKNASHSRPNPPTGIPFWNVSRRPAAAVQPGTNPPPTFAWLVKGTSRAASWHDSWLPQEGSNLRGRENTQDGSHSLLIT